MEEGRISFRNRFIEVIQNRWTILAFRLFLGGLLIYASFDKISHPDAFAKIVRNYHLIPYSMSNLLALVLPWTELFVGFCLILGIFLDGAAFMTTVLMGIFMIALTQVVIRGIDIDCGCFKVTQASSKVGLQRIVEDLIYFLIAFLIWRRKKKFWEFVPSRPPQAGSAGRIAKFI